MVLFMVIIVVVVIFVVIVTVFFMELQNGSGSDRGFVCSKTRK